LELVVAGAGLQQEVVERAEGEVVKADAIRPLAGEHEDARTSAHAVGPPDGWSWLTVTCPPSQRTVTSSPSVVPLTVRMPSATFETIVPARADEIHTIEVAMAAARTRTRRMSGIRYRFVATWRAGGFG